MPTTQEIKITINMDKETRKALAELIDRATNVGAKLEFECDVHATNTDELGNVLDTHTAKLRTRLA